MRSIVTGLLLLVCQAFGGEWVITSGGLSPDKKLAVAVFPQSSEFIDQADATVLLVDQVRGRKIGPLEEVSSSGGTWGTTTTNVRCVWSTDSNVLIVNYRTGRLMHSVQVYRIRDGRATPLVLPDAKTHPKGVALQGLEVNANPGSEATFGENGSIDKRCWGYIPDSSVDYSKLGLEGFEGSLLFHYRFDKSGKPTLGNITVPPQYSMSRRNTPAKASQVLVTRSSTCNASHHTLAGCPCACTGTTGGSSFR